MNTIKEEAKRLIDNLPNDATWDDLLYEFYVKNKVQIALDAVDNKHTVSHEEAKKRLLLR